MALYPGAIDKLIEPGSNDPRITPRLVILHVAVSEADSLYDYFAHHSGGIESHFYIRYDGTIEQYRDTGWQADANYRANDFAISIETEGMGAGKWTAAQMASIKALVLWAHQTHGIPLVKAARWDGTGVGYHSQFPEWSPVAKSCPGPGRIAQYQAQIVPWMHDAPEEDDMPYSPDDLAKIVRDATQILCPDGDTRPLSQALRHVMATQDAQGNALRRILAKANTGLSDADKADINKMLADAVIDVDVKVDGQ